MSNTVVNLTLDENESQNFFTNLTEGLQNEKHINLNENENEKEHNNKTQEMLERVNSSQKTIGHNRFQQKIEELEREVEKYNLYKKEQEMKLSLFKKTISSLQTQLQQRSSYREIPLSDTDNIKTIEEQSELIKSLTLEISTLKLKNESLDNLLSTQSLTINKLENEKSLIVNKYDILKTEYEKLNKLNSDNVSKLNKEISNKSELQNKLNFELSLRENLESELLILKDQSKTIQLQKEILNKDIIIANLNEQLIKIQSELFSKTDNIQKETTKITKQIIQGRSRGLTNTTRGLHSTRR